MSRAFAKREAHRRALNVHMVILCVGVLALFAINRFVTPERFWAHWVALAWGVAFALHLAIFARGTIATMGGAKGGTPPGSPGRGVGEGSEPPG